TKDGYLALAMGNLSKISQLIGCDISELYTDASASFENRDALLQLLGQTLSTQTNQYWLDLLEPADIWCTAVLNYSEAVELDVFKNQQIKQQLDLGEGRTIDTTRAPIRIDGHKLYAAKAAPKIGEDNEKINKEFDLK